MRRVAASQHLDAVELSFSGNALSPCMRGYVPNTQANLDKYRSDALSAVGIFSAAGAHVFLIGAPITRTQYETGNPEAKDISKVYASIAAADPSHVTFVDAGAAVEGPNGSYVQTMSCLLAEPCTGPTLAGVPSNVVRSPDGTHFCPEAVGDAQGVVAGCAVYSSGAYRFANAMAAALEVPR